MRYWMIPAGAAAMAVVCGLLSRWLPLVEWQEVWDAYRPMERATLMGKIAVVFASVCIASLFLWALMGEFTP